MIQALPYPCIQAALILFVIGLPSVSADQFGDQIAPYVNKYCLDCHGQEDPKGGLDLTKFDSDRSVIAGFRRWNNITTFIQSGEMPPKGSPQPEIEER